MKNTIPSRSSDHRGSNVFISNLINRGNVRKHQETTTFETCLIPKFKILQFGPSWSCHLLGSTKTSLPHLPANFWNQLPDAKSRFAEAGRPRELKRLEKELQAQFDSAYWWGSWNTPQHIMASILFNGLNFRPCQHAKLDVGICWPCFLSKWQRLWMNLELCNTADFRACIQIIKQNRLQQRGLCLCIVWADWQGF